MKIWRWIAGGGVVLALVGIVALIWTELALPATPFSDSGLERWQTAMAPLFLTALGLLVVTAALILRFVGSRAVPNQADAAR
jgi:protein-S-isoprenylcysteine O-methyltransferase Ste14